MRRPARSPRKKPIRMTIIRKRTSCPRCGTLSKRHSICTRTLLDVGLRVILVRYSKHYCPMCRRHFSLQIPGLAPASGKYTYAMRALAVKGRKAGTTLEKLAVSIRVPATTIHDWRGSHAKTA